MSLEINVSFMAKSYKQKLKPRLFPADPLMMMFGRAQPVQDL